MEGSSHPKVTHYHPIPAMTANINYVTRDFVRRDCSIEGAQLSDRDCDRVIEEVSRLNAAGEFHHTGVYWIANRLAADGAIHPTLPETR